MTRASGLDDRDQAQFAWARFRKIMWGMSALALATSLGVVALLWAWGDPLPWIFVALIIGGIWATIMMAALLMGLMFLSSGTGHDEHVDDRISAQVLDDE